VLGPAASYLYFRAGGDAVWEVVQGGVPKAVGGFHVVMGSAVAYTLLLVVVVLLARKRPSLVSLPAGILLLVWAYGSIGGAEFIRENARKPWIIGNVEHGGYMLVHGLRPDQVAITQTAGLLAEARYQLPPAPGEGAQTNQGRNLFRLACRACHTLSGYNAIRPLVDGKSLAIITGILRTLDVRRGRMPAFPGNEEEQTLLAHFLAGLDGELEPQAGGSMPDRGRRLLDEYCLTCHSIDADDDDPPALLPRVRGWSAQVAYQKLGMLDELSDEMPAFEGTPEERKTLAETLAELASGGAR
jgi:mono/diheme cytochrome c family protein